MCRVHECVYMHVYVHDAVCLCMCMACVCACVCKCVLCVCICVYACVGIREGKLVTLKSKVFNVYIARLPLASDDKQPDYTQYVDYYRYPLQVL